MSNGIWKAHHFERYVYATMAGWPQCVFGAFGAPHLRSVWKGYEGA